MVGESQDFRATDMMAMNLTLSERYAGLDMTWGIGVVASGLSDLFEEFLALRVLEALLWIWKTRRTRGRRGILAGTVATWRNG